MEGNVGRDVCNSSVLAIVPFPLSPLFHLGDARLLAPLARCFCRLTGRRKVAMGLLGHLLWTLGTVCLVAGRATGTADDQQVRWLEPVRVSGAPDEVGVGNVLHGRVERVAYPAFHRRYHSVMRETEGERNDCLRLSHLSAGVLRAAGRVGLVHPVLARGLRAARAAGGGARRAAGARLVRARLLGLRRAQPRRLLRPVAGLARPHAPPGHLGGGWPPAR